MIGSDLEMMRKRYDFLSELVKDYKSVDNFFEDKKEWFDIVGIELTKAENFLGVYFFRIAIYSMTVPNSCIVHYIMVD